jgi:hypothetical protein
MGGIKTFGANVRRTNDAANMPPIGGGGNNGTGFFCMTIKKHVDAGRVLETSSGTVVPVTTGGDRDEAFPNW